MTRAALYSPALLIILAASPAFAQQDDMQALMAQCAEPAPDAIDACIERARVLDETNPTPDLQAFIAQLIQREASMPDQGTADRPPQQDSGQAAAPTDDYVPPPATDTAAPAPASDANSQDETPPDPQPTPADMSPPDNTAPSPAAADTEPPAPPGGSLSH